MESALRTTNCCPVRHRSRLWSQLIVLEFGIVISLQIPPGFCGWPEGTYGLPAAKEGCPNDGTFLWKTGSVLQKTELGSHASVNNHLLGIDDDSSVSDRILQTFCVKITSASDNRHHFMPGKYCILKNEECPARFQDGWIYWDDAGPFFGPTIQNSNGSLPNGLFNRNTRIDYCCRTDGAADQSIVLPTAEPFFLLKLGDVCQQVEGMNVNEEWVHWAGETSFNRDSEYGLHPKLERSKFPFTYTKLYYCYYVPKPQVVVSLSSWFETFLVVLYVLGATFGIILLAAIILASVQRALLFQRQNRHQQQQQQSTGTRATKQNLEMGSVAPNGTSHGVGLPDYSSCQVQAPPTHDLGTCTTKPTNGKTAQIQSTVTDECSSMESINLLPDADSEAPPSYDEVLREINRPVVVVVQS